MANAAQRAQAKASAKASGGPASNHPNSAIKPVKKPKTKIEESMPSIVRQAAGDAVKR
jgi:hypothetical protein